MTYNGTTTLTDKQGNVEKFETNYFDVLKNLTSAFSEPYLPDLPKLTGGAVGFSSYDTFRLVEYLPNIPSDDLNLPDAIWSFYDEIYAFDHVKHQVVLIKTVFIEGDSDIEASYEDAIRAIDRMETVASNIKAEKRSFKIHPESLSSNMEESYFNNMVQKSKDYIFEGDIFQVVLSQRFDANMEGDAFMLYRALRMVNPSPYLFF